METLIQALLAVALNIKTRFRLARRRQFAPVVARRARWAGSMRRGLSLLEVLISILVTLVGLLGLAALIPAGHLQMQKASRTDHAAALGRGVLKELRFRGLLDPRKWWVATDNVWSPLAADPVLAPQSTASTGTVTANYFTDLGFVIDPIGVANLADAAPGNRDTWFFPSTVQSTVPTNFPILRRVGVKEPAQVNNVLLNTSTAERLCRQEDELVLQAAADANPSGGFTDDDPPVQVFDDDASGARRSFKGNLTWLATLVRSPRPLTADGALPMNWTRSPNEFIVSVVVQYNREFDDPDLGLPLFGGETYVRAFTGPIDGTTPPQIPEDGSTTQFKFSSGMIPGTGGGQVILGNPSVPITNATEYGPAAPALMARLRAGQWIMLVRRTRPLNAGGPIVGGYARWYRISHVNPVDADEVDHRVLQLHGPEWPPPVPGPGTDEKVWDYAILLENVIGVYEEVIELENTADLTPSF